jgi:membrane-associated phospholipid phosphatase
MNTRVNRLLACAAGLGLALSAVLVAAYYAGPVQRADATALASLRSLSSNHDGTVYFVGDAFAHSVDLPFLVAAVAVLCAVGVALGRRRQALGAVVLVAVANTLAQVMQILAAHPRYQAALAPHQLSPAAFPSGHATAVMSLALAAVLVAPSRWRPLTALVAGAYALAVSISLLIQGWHFPSDVMGAFLLVGLVTMLVLAGLVAAENESPERRTETLRARAQLRSTGLAALQLGLLGLAICGGVLLATHPGAPASYVADHTTAAVAALAIAAVSLGLVSGVTAELEAG